MHSRPCCRFVRMALATMFAAFVTGCTTSVDDPTRNLAEQATVYIAPDDAHVVVAALTLINTGPIPLELVWSEDCIGAGSLTVRAYRTVGGVSVLAWDSSRFPLIAACPTVIHHDTIVTAAVKAFQRRMAMSAILGDSLPAGAYRFTVLSALLSPALPAELATATLPLSAGP